MKVRNISEAKAELSALIEEVLKGNEVILAKAGKPVARLVAYKGPIRPRTPGSMAGEIHMAPDFDVLPDDIAEEFGLPGCRGNKTATRHAPAALVAGGDPSLPQPARALNSDPDNAVFVSAVSLWEIWLKQSLGKLRLPANFQAADSYGVVRGLPLTAAHTRQVAVLPWHHRDPFDRMLVAQAQVVDLTFLTADQATAAYGDPVVCCE